jgi:hypothetical protein
MERKESQAHLTTAPRGQTVRRGNEKGSTEGCYLATIFCREECWWMLRSLHAFVGRKWLFGEVTQFCCELDLKWEVIVKSGLIIPTFPQKYKFGDCLIKELVSCFNRV